MRAQHGEWSAGGIPEKVQRFLLTALPLGIATSKTGVNLHVFMEHRPGFACAQRQMVENRLLAGSQRAYICTCRHVMTYNAGEMQLAWLQGIPLPLHHVSLQISMMLAAQVYGRKACMLHHHLRASWQHIAWWKNPATLTDKPLGEHARKQNPN